MAYRTRTIKHDFFLNEHLAELSPQVRLLYIGLWLCCDREGRIEDRPKKLKAEIFPYEDYDIDNMLDELAMGDDPFIIRYTVDGENYIWIPKFTKHQSIHPKEQKSVFPPCPEITGNYREFPENKINDGERPEITGKYRVTEKIADHPKVNDTNGLEERPEITGNSLERPEIPPSSSSTSTSTSTSSSSSSRDAKKGKQKNKRKEEEEEEIEKLSEKEKIILDLAEKLWLNTGIRPHTPAWENVIEISQYSDEAILECFAAAQQSGVRRNNWDWVLNRLRNPERYGVKLESQNNHKARLKELHIILRAGGEWATGKQAIIEMAKLTEADVMSVVNEYKLELTEAQVEELINDKGG